MQFSFYNLLAVFIDGAEIFDLSNDGLFGFMASENVLFCLGPYSFFAGFWGCAGYVWALQYWSPLIVMNCLLIEPLLGQLFACLM